jgi:hypothetical protein
VTGVSHEPITIDADDLAMLADGFRAAMAAAPGVGAADADVFDLGWGELLPAAPGPGAATAFAEMGLTGAAPGLLDDVVAVALGRSASLDTAVVLPAPQLAAAPARRTDGCVVVDGLVSGRLDLATTALVMVTDELVAVDAASLRGGRVDTERALDPDQAYRRVRIELDGAATTAVGCTGTWDAAVGAARAALAHQLVAASRWMLDAARSHALDRHQFGRPVASFQAVRHKLADALVAIEGAASVAEACGPDADPLLSTLAKSLAGRAARLTTANAQQVLAGIGFTTDHPFHRWMKRSLVVDTLFGSAATLPGEIGRELLRRGEAPRVVHL